MKGKKYLTVVTVSNSNRNIVEKGKLGTLNIYIYDRSLFWLDKDNPIKVASLHFFRTCGLASFFPYASKMHIYIRYLNYRCLNIF